ncbi:MAG: hypothetical protein WEF53_06165 [Bacteroidota bacterium]
MAAETVEKLLLLIEVLTKEVAAIKTTCSEARWTALCGLADFSHEEGLQFQDVMEFNAIHDYDRALKETVDRASDIIRLASERVLELNPPPEFEDG